MVESPHVLLLIAAGPADRRRLEGLLPPAAAELHSIARPAPGALTARRHDAVLVAAGSDDGATVRALIEEDPRAPVLLLGDPSGPHEIAGARALGAADHLPLAALDAPTLLRALRYAADHRRAVERLQHDALHDALTGLPNRTLFLDRLEQSLRRGRRRTSAATRRAAVLFVDLDRFKLVNDSLGHQAGDVLLREVARRLDGALRPGDTVARMGGDEFTVLLEDIADPREASAVAERVLATLADPLVVAGRELHVSASIGIALAHAESEPEALIRDADVAMYRAKARGAAGHATFDQRMHRRVVDRLELETRLRRAIDERALELRYQPIVRTATGAVTGFEALCRWEVEPRRFLALAEESGLIVPLGRFVLGEAARRAAAWRTVVAVNVSARQLSHPGFASAVEAALADSGAAHEHLRLELTEYAMTQEPEQARAVLTDLRARLGVGAHLDDFGTGASSLCLLHRFPGDALKIDVELVGELLAEPGSQRIVGAIVGLAHDLGLEVVGEGVETAAQLERLAALGCDLVQGFHLSPPLDAAAAQALLDAAGHDPAAPVPG